MLVLNQLKFHLPGGTSMFKEFKEFAMRGNVMDMAVGIIIGAAFGKIITSFVTDVLMPPIGLLMGGADFTNYFVSLSGQTFPSLAAAKEAGAPTINYGVFLNTVIDFLIVAFAIFLIIRQLNKLKREAPAPAPTQRECPQCLSSIPLKARRCAHCTVELAPASAAKPV
jgi:large conductance mechanosensitive channel